MPPAVAVDEIVHHGVDLVVVACRVVVVPPLLSGHVHQFIERAKDVLGKSPTDATGPTAADRHLAVRAAGVDGPGDQPRACPQGFAEVLGQTFVDPKRQGHPRSGDDAMGHLVKAFVLDNMPDALAAEDVGIDDRAKLAAGVDPRAAGCAPVECVLEVLLIAVEKDRQRPGQRAVKAGRLALIESGHVLQPGGGFPQLRRCEIGVNAVRPNRVQSGAIGSGGCLGRRGGQQGTGAAECDGEGDNAGLGAAGKLHGRTVLPETRLDSNGNARLLHYCPMRRMPSLPACLALRMAWSACWSNSRQVWPYSG